MRGLVRKRWFHNLIGLLLFGEKKKPGKVGLREGFLNRKGNYFNWVCHNRVNFKNSINTSHCRTIRKQSFLGTQKLMYPETDLLRIISVSGTAVSEEKN